MKLLERGANNLSSRRFAIPFCAQFLIHSLSPKIMNQRSPFCGEMSAQHRQILAHGSMREKLLDQRLPIRVGFREQQNSGCEAIDAMDYQSALPTRLEILQKKR